MDVKMGKGFCHGTGKCSVGGNEDDCIRRECCYPVIFFEKRPFLPVPVKPPGVGIDICIFPEIDPFNIIKTAYSDIKNTFPAF